MSSVANQDQIWGLRARDWAEIQEGMFKPLFEAVLQATGVGPGCELLDVGCASCIYCEMADKLGAHVTGLDSAEAMLDFARERVPQGVFQSGDMEHLPFADRSFDVVTGFNSFQYAADPVKALKEAHRVLRPGGLLAIGIWGKPADCQGIVYLPALSKLMPPPPPGMPGPFSLSPDGVLESVVRQAGMNPGVVEEIDVPWTYPDEATLLRGVLSPAPIIRASQILGDAVVRETILQAVHPFKTATGSFVFKNKARYMIVKV